MSTQIILIIIGVMVLVLCVGYIATNSDKEVTNVYPEPIAEVASKSKKEVVATGETTAAEEATTIEDITPGVYTSYDADAIAHSDAKHILLFFYATWCPTCKALDTDIVAHADSIPAGVEIYKVDYDTSTDLKRKYGVTTQHSIIEIDASGKALSGISHPLNLKGVLATI